MHGEGKPSREIAAVCKVNPKTVQKWVAQWEAEGFPKGFLGAKLDQKEVDTVLAQRERMGLTRAKVDQRIVDLMHAKKTVFWQGVRVADVEDNGTAATMTNLATEVLGMKKADQESERANDNLLTLIRSMRPK